MIDKQILDSMISIHPEWVLHPLSKPTDEGNSPGKRPLIPEWQKLTKTPNLDIYIEQGCNIGIVSGEASQVTILDLDSFLFIEEIFKGTDIKPLNSKHADNRGHIYFKYNSNLEATKHHDLSIEVMGNGNNVVVAPSIHKSGEVYRWSDQTLQIQDMPKQIEDNLKSLFKTEQELKKLIGKCRTCFRSILKDKPNLHGADGRLYMIAICTDLKAIGAKDEHIKMFAKLLYGKYYDEKRTLIEWQNIDASKPWKCETLQTKLSSMIDLTKCDECAKQRKFRKNKETDNFGLASAVQEVKPIYFDRSLNYWLWDASEGCYSKIDQIDVLSNVELITNERVINRNTVYEILKGIEITGRRINVKDVPNTWIHTKSGVFDIKTNNRFEATTEYFFSTPIPHKIGTSTETPVIDKLLNDWCADKKEMLYEIFAYCLLDDYPIHRMFLLFGSGRNGKSQFLELVARFIGWKNTTATELEKIIDSRFEAAKLYRKKVALIGETNFSAIKSSDRIKKITGHDTLTAEFKGKDPFDFTNTAKILIATNSIPETLDKTEAFHSRCIIIEFKNRFDEGKSVIDPIPESEYENLLAKCLDILPKLLGNGRFTKEGTIEEKSLKYESLSNIWEGYFNKCLDSSDVNADTPLWEIKDDYIDYCKKNGLRQESDKAVSRNLKEAGFIIEKRSINNSSQYYVSGVKFVVKDLKDKTKMTQMTQMTQTPLNSISPIELNESNVINVINVISDTKTDKHVTQIKEIEDFKNSSLWNKGEINTSNLTEFVMLFCKQSGKDCTPSEIKKLTTKMFKITPKKPNNPSLLCKNDRHDSCGGFECGCECHNKH